MKKEIVTKDNIQFDIQNYCTYYFKKLIFPLTFTFIYSCVLITLCLLIPFDIPYLILKFIGYFCAVQVLITTIIVLYKKKNYYTKILNISKSKDFKITTDTFECIKSANDCSDVERWLMIRGITRRLHRTLCLRFNNSGEYKIPHGPNYAWSKNLAMSQAAVATTSTLGDEYYLIKANNEIIMAYNTKFFEIQE